jgi:hypothetical protein
VFEFLAEGVILERQPLQVGDGDFDLVGEFPVCAAEAGELAGRVVIASQVLCAGGAARASGGSPLVGDFAGDLGKVPPEGAVGQAEGSREREDRGLPGTGLRGQLGERLPDLGFAWQLNSRCHVSSMS